MSDKDDKPTPEDQVEDKVENQTDNNKPEQIASDKTSKKTCRGRSFAVIFLILFGSLTGGGYYLWKELQQTKVDLAEMGNNAQVQSGLRAGNIAAMENAIKQLGQKQNEQSDALASLYRDTQGNNEDWAIAEIEYLLIIAMHRLLLEEDVMTALAAMEAADLRLKGLGDPGLLPVRKQLTTDMNQLRAVNHPDIAGMAIYLADMVDLSADLPLKSEVTTNTIAAHSLDEDQVNDGVDVDPFWKRLPKIIWLEIKSWIVIKRTGDVNQALLLPSEEYFLTQNLRLELESARLSVLRADSGNLRASVVLIQSWLRQYFDTSDSAVMNVMETLDQMQAIELKPALPDISSSVESLRAYLRYVASEAMNTEEAASVENGVQ